MCSGSFRRKQKDQAPYDMHSCSHHQPRLSALLCSSWHPWLSVARATSAQTYDCTSVHRFQDGQEQDEKDLNSIPSCS